MKMVLDLIKMFRTYLALDVMLAFMDAEIVQVLQAGNGR